MFDYNYDRLFNPENWNSKKEMLDYLRSLDDYDDIFGEEEDVTIIEARSEDF